MEALYNYIKDGNSIVDLIGALIILALIALSLEKIFLWIKKYLDLYTQRKLNRKNFFEQVHKNEHKMNEIIEKNKKQDEEIKEVLNMIQELIANNDKDMQVIHRKELKYFYELAISQDGKLSEKDMRDYHSSLKCYESHHGNDWVHSDIIPYIEKVQIIPDIPVQNQTE